MAPKKRKVVEVPSLVPEAMAIEDALDKVDQKTSITQIAEKAPEPLAPSTLPTDPSAAVPEEVMVAQIIAQTMVGREVSNYTNRAFIMPICYVPRGSDTIEEIAQRSQPSQQAPAATGADNTQASESEVLAPQPPPVAMKKAIASEEGVQFDTVNAFVCPFMIHQRVARRGFVSDSIRDSAMVGSEPAAAFELNPYQVLAKVTELAKSKAGKHALKLTSVCAGTTTFSIEQALMRHSARPALEPPQSLAECLLIDCDIRLGTIAVFPKSIEQVSPSDLTEAQHSYISRFQLLDSTPVTASTSGEAEEGPGVNVASDVVVGAFDPYFSSSKYASLHQTLKKMSATKADRVAEAVNLRSKVPIYQLCFQSRTGEEEMVLETHDAGKSWSEIRSQEILGSVAAPIVNTQKHAMEAVLSAKHIVRCDSLMAEWASFYLRHSFQTGSEKAVDKKGQLDRGVKSTNSNRATEEIADIGYVHPASQNFLDDYSALRKRWQLVSVEKIGVQAAQCAESKKYLPHLALVAEDDGAAVDNALGVAAGSSGMESSSLILWMWHHTKTLFADDGVGFLRGATTFRRRISASNENLLRERTYLWGADSVKNTNRLGMAVQSVFNGLTSAIAHRFVELTASAENMNSLAGEVPIYVFASGNSSGLPQLMASTAIAPTLPEQATSEPVKDSSVAADGVTAAETATQPVVEVSLATKPQTIASSISVKEHGAFLHKLAISHPPIVELAKSFAFHAYIPWGTVHYPLSLNAFTDMKQTISVASDEEKAPSVASSAVPTFVVREGGLKGLLKVGSTPSALDVPLAASAPLSFSNEALKEAMGSSAITEGMRNLLTSSFDTKTTSPSASVAPVFAASYGHRDWASFDCQASLSEILFRLGKSVKTTVSALCFTDQPSSAMRLLNPVAAEAINNTHTPLGTRSITSVYLDSKDASRSQVTNISKLFKSPGAQEHGIRTFLRRMLAPTSLQQAQVLVQSVGGGQEQDGVARELVPAGAEEPAVDEQPYVYKISVLPEEAIDVFRPVSNETIKSEDASTMAELSGKMSAMEALYVASGDAEEGKAEGATSAKEALKEMIRNAVNVSQVILENSKATSVAQLLESKVKGDSTFSYLPQLLEAIGGSTVDVAQNNTRGAQKLKKLLHRGLSRVVFAEDKYFVSEELPGSKSRSEPIPTTYVIHRTLHDVSVGSDGIARYEKANFVLFTLRDPDIITAAKGNALKVQELLAARAEDTTLSPPTVANSATSRDIPLIKDIFSLLYNFGRWGIDSQFSANIKRDVSRLEARTASGDAVHHVLKGWLQSALSQQSADVLAMTQGDERLARNPLVHLLADASSKCSTEVQTMCRNELLHWVAGLAEGAAISNIRELEHAYLTMDMRRVFKKCGIPAELLPHMFYPKPEEVSHEDKRLEEKDINPFLRSLPCDSFCRMISKLSVDFGSNAVVPVTVPMTIHTSDGMPVPEGSVAFVGHASMDLISKCNSYFGEMTPIHQLGDLLVVPATQDIDASVAVELSGPQDTVWQSSMELQFGRMKMISGQSVIMKRHRYNQFVPPSTIERSFVQSGARYTIPPVGTPLYKKGKLVTFNKGHGAHEFVSKILQSGNLRQVVSHLTK